MANQQHLDILRQGVHIWNQWREERKEWEWEESIETIDHFSFIKRHPQYIDLSGANLQEWDLRRVNLSGAYLKDTRFVRADLKEANLSQAFLYGALFDQANLERADLSGAFLMKASVGGANLWKVSLRKANLTWTSFFHAFLAEADLREANLAQTNFTWAILHGMNIQQASINHTIFGDVDLSEVKGLEILHHFNPPLIDIYTLARSSGRIPETFLQQAGIESAIIPSLLALFHPYHGAETGWWSEEPPSGAWHTSTRPKGVPQVCPGFPPWTHGETVPDEAL